MCFHWLIIGRLFCPYAQSVNPDESADLDESTPIDESTEWTKENLQKLLAAMKTSYPEEYGDVAYPAGLKAVDWEKVAFPPFSPEACQNKWRKILHEVINNFKLLNFHLSKNMFTFLIKSYDILQWMEMIHWSLKQWIATLCFTLNLKPACCL